MSRNRDVYDRDWERGKPEWEEDPGWSGSGNRSQWRGDEAYGGGKGYYPPPEDYYHDMDSRPTWSEPGDPEGDWKRRRISHDEYQGVPPPHSSYDEGTYSQRDPRGGYRDEYDDRENYSNRGARDHDPNRRRLAPSEPSPHVIFLGLDPDFTEADLQGFLLSLHLAVESCTIIRDRTTGASKAFGFAQFASTDHARMFLEPNFPFVQLPPPASHAAYGYPAGPGGPGRRVKIDFSQSAHPPDARRGRGELGGRLAINDGTRDIGSAHAPVVLLRGLDFNSSVKDVEEALRGAEGVGKVGAQGMVRILVIMNKSMKKNWGFAFVEFIDVTSASVLLGAVMSPQIHPSGFRILSRPVAASFAHPYSFQLLPPNAIKDEWCVSASAAIGGRDEGWARYWDEGAGISELAFEVERPSKDAGKDKVKEKKKDKMKSERDGSNTKVVGAPGLTVLSDVASGPTALIATGAPVSLNLSKSKESGDKKGLTPVTKVGENTGVFSATDFSDDNANDQEGGADSLGKDSNDKAVNSYAKVPPMISSKKVASNITKWNSVKGDTSAPSDNADVDPKDFVAGEGEFLYGDPKGLLCLLCGRQFKLLEQLRRHNKESDLHKKNLQDPALREEGHRKAQQAQLKGPPKPPGDGLPPPKYRDRALERRTAFRQPDMPQISGGEVSLKRKYSRGPTPPPPPPPPAIIPAKDEENVGNKLLKKMGWSEGSGLGAGGEGRVEPIQAAMYTEGVGLGASKGKDVTKLSQGFNYSSMAKDSARERFAE